LSAREQFAEDIVARKTAFRTTAPAHGPLTLRSRVVVLPAPRMPAGGFSPFQSAVKRAMDVSIAAALLVLLMPLLLAIAVVVWLDRRGPVLFRQKRLGLNGTPFDIIKFRTMQVLENGDDVRQAEPNDVRVTRIGRFLRALSLDELPQLINVLKGEMSLVGPRPHAIAHDKFFGALIDGYEQRQRVKPGITGLAQVSGLRGPTPTAEAMRRRVDVDLDYVRNARLALDFAILLRTPVEIFRRRNAV
jgi:putative colanic acid biosysnthesis UDP-glucose lipid carrier transferase